jgi:L-lactate utilization protein LutC
MDTNNIASQETLDKTVASLASHNFQALVVDTKEEALAKIKELIPAGVSVMNGTSTTLQEIGYIDYLKAGQHGWNNLHANILAEQDKDKQALLRKQSVISDFYLGSAHAVTEDGQIMIASASGSQLPHLAFTSQNIILVVGTQKIVPDLQAAFKRIDDVVVPQEDVRMKSVYGPESGTLHAKTLILHKESPRMGRTVRVIFVKEKLGF